MDAPAYDRMGIEYAQVRRADPRIEAAIHAALGDAGTVLNVGAGAGSYEPADREVLAVEPSPVMIAQRPPGAAPAIEAVVEDLPLADDSVDAVMGVFTMQHWSDIGRGLAEVARVGRDRAVFVTLDIDVAESMWLGADYLPEMIEADRRDFPSLEQLASALPGLVVNEIPVPSDCRDGFCIGLWSRPEAHLEPRVRRASSTWHRLDPGVVERALGRLAADLENGEWDRRHGHLRELDELDVGLRLVQADLRSESETSRAGPPGPGSI
ncbi:MAG TPA: methyltransferase domain-containing protein [Solirubrobacterales bacterium]